MSTPAKATAWHVYLLRCADGTFYTGITTDLARRLRQHNGELSGGARYTQARRPVELAWKDVCESRSAAAKAEHRIRRLSRTQKRALIQSSIITD